jgi:hypothetical protein
MGRTDQQLAQDLDVARRPGESAAEVRARRRAAQREIERRQIINEGVREADEAIRQGRRFLPPDEQAWLNVIDDPANPLRRRQLAYDPDIGFYRVREAMQAVDAETQGVLPRPMRRAIDPGLDFTDGRGTGWSFKGFEPGDAVPHVVERVTGPARGGSRVWADLRGMTPNDAATVVADVQAALRPGAAEVHFWMPDGSVRVVRP